VKWLKPLVNLNQNQKNHLKKMIKSLNPKKKKKNLNPKKRR